MAFAKIDRNIIDSEIYYNDQLLSFYVRLIMLSRIRPYRDHGILVDKGQLFTSIRKLGAVLNYKSTNTLKLLNSLEEKHLISIEKYTSGSLITILDVDSETKYPKKREQQKKCSREHFANTLRTPTLLYKKEKKVEKGVQRAREQNANFENSTEEAEVIEVGFGKKSENLLSESGIENNRALLKITPTREELIEKYGEENVLDYENRFERWRSRQQKPVLITCYDAIERWMRDDGVEKPKEKYSEAAFDTDEIMKRIMENYRG